MRKAEGVIYFSLLWNISVVSKFKLKKKDSYPFGPLVAYHETISMWSKILTPLGSEGFPETMEAPHFSVSADSFNKGDIYL